MRSGTLALLLAAQLHAAAQPLTVNDAFLVECAKGAPSCASYLTATPPDHFRVRVSTSRGGAFTVHVTTAWAPPFATRFYRLALLKYGEGGPFYRVLALNRTERFVTQFGYRGVPDVDIAWIQLQTSNATSAVVPPGNVRGTVAFGTSEVANDGRNPNCTAAQCSLGFSVELFVNLANNSRLDGADFSPFGRIEERDMGAVDALFAGYGECSDLCEAEGGAEPYCLPGRDPGTYAGVNLTRLLGPGGGVRDYTRPDFPALDYVTTVELL